MSNALGAIFGFFDSLPIEKIVLMYEPNGIRGLMRAVENYIEVNGIIVPSVCGSGGVFGFVSEDEFGKYLESREGRFGGKMGEKGEV